MDFVHLTLFMLVGVMKAREDEQYSPEETARRQDEAIRRALNMPPKPQSNIVGKSGRKRRVPTKSRST
jgi:hypothetical protein